VVSNWARTKEGLEWQVTIPPNATATIVLPADAVGDIREGPGVGVPASRADGVRDARMDGKTAVFSVGSGSYRFASRPRVR
jgi:alpha-L-rhamnosidase